MTAEMGGGCKHLQSMCKGNSTMLKLMGNQLVGSQMGLLQGLCQTGFAWGKVDDDFHVQSLEKLLRVQEKWEKKSLYQVIFCCKVYTVQVLRKIFAKP